MARIREIPARQVKSWRLTARAPRQIRQVAERGLRARCLNRATGVLRQAAHQPQTQAKRGAALPVGLKRAVPGRARHVHRPRLDPVALRVQHQRARAVEAHGLAVDQPSMVRRYLSQKPLSFPVGLAGFNGTELGKTLGNAQSVLPFSVIFDAKGGLLAQKAGKLEQSDLDAWLKKVT